MPRLHFPNQALILRMVEHCVTSGKPLMLAHDHGLYLCTDGIKGADGHCVCAFVDGCDPDIDEEAHETANALVGFDDFGVSIPLGGEHTILADLKRGHRLAIGFGRRAVTVLTQAPTKQQSTPVARGRGAESHPTARNGNTAMTKTASKKKTSKTMKSTKSTKAKPAGSSEKLRKAAIAEIGERLAKLDGDPRAGGNAKAAKAKQATDAPPKASKEKKAPKAKRTSALDAAAQVLEGAKEPMTAGALIDAMATRDLWKSPGGKTPGATLYAALIREIKAKGKDARFRKTDRGLFIATNGKKD